MLSLAKFIKKEIELRENLVGTGFLDPPPLQKLEDPATGDIIIESDYRCTVLGKFANHYHYAIPYSPFHCMSSGSFANSLFIFFFFFLVLGEIVETVGFEAENTYIFYDTFLPEGWTFEESNE